MAIKIFVSNRIDVESYQINSPLYYPVRCGAIFDNRVNISMLGDNTGENISEKRNSYGEFTVQYWAWKNEQADYIGLCHYRRYLSFSNNQYKVNTQAEVMEKFLNADTCHKYRLDEFEQNIDVIKNYDALINCPADVTIIPTPQGVKNTVLEHWKAHDRVLLPKEAIDILCLQINNCNKDLIDAANTYLNGKWHRGYNCYIFKKELFDKLCDFQFSLLFEVEKKLEKAGLNTGRTMGYLGEILYGIFCQYLINQNEYKIRELQLVYFEQTKGIKTGIARNFQSLLFFLKFKLEDFLFIILPKGSRLRALVKKIYFYLIR